MKKTETLILNLCSKKLTEQDITDFQQNFKIHLPDDFVKHYLSFNGGFPNANWSDGIENNCPLRHFFSITYGEDTIEKRAKELELLDVLPFAMNKIKGYFCIGINDENYGQIFYYRKRPIVKNYKETYDMNEIELHCSNFSTFLSNFFFDQFYGKVPKPSFGWVEDFDAYTKRW